MGVGVCWCWCWCWCWCVTLISTSTLSKPLLSPCVRAKRPRVYRHHARKTPHRTHTPRPQKHTHKRQQPPQHTETGTERDRERRKRKCREDERLEKRRSRDKKREDERREKTREEKITRASGNFDTMFSCHDVFFRFADLAIVGKSLLDGNKDHLLNQTRSERTREQKHKG